MPPRQVVLDTNFLLIPFQFKIDILRELDYLIETSHRYVISSKTVSELKKIAKSGSRDMRAARLALKLVEKNKDSIEIIKSDMFVDDWIVLYAEKNNAIVCTNDAKLRKRLKELRVKMVTLKSRSRLGFV